MRAGRWLVGLLAAAAVCSPQSAGAFTIFGEPPLVSAGQVRSLPFTLFGEQVTPRLDIDGFLRYQVVGSRLNGKSGGLMAPELSLDVNLQLTATQRIHALFRPLDQGNGKPTFYQWPENSGWTVRAEGEPAAIWYEGQPFNWLTPRDSFPLDISVAGGRFPMYFHNGLWFDNILDGFALAKLNLQVGNLSTLGLVYFLSRGQTQGGTTEVEQREERKNVMGLVATADWWGYHVEASWGVGYDNPSTLEFPEDRNRHFWGVSVTRTFGDAGVSLRLLGSTGNRSRDAGVLFVVETAKGFEGFRVYANGFVGSDDWMPVSTQGSRTNRLGILFTQDRLLPFPGLRGFANESLGGVVGVILNAKGTVTVTPEFGAVRDNSSLRNDQFGGAVQIQADLASLLMPGATLEDTRRRGLLYGLLGVLTLAGVGNSNDGSGRGRTDYGARLELIYKF
jgi:hypothetical protein